MRRLTTALACLLLLGGLTACGSSSGPKAATPSSTRSTGTTTRSQPADGTPTGPPTTFVADVWADNWFALYANGTAIGEDPVPITTERSFNKESFTFDAYYPLTIGIEAKDYVADESGLEYIGTPRQQIGDGGLIAQIREQATGRVVATTGPDWRVLVVSRAPLNPDCVTSADPATDCRHESQPVPAKWSSPSFDDSAWPKATVYTEGQVSPKDGYTEVTWDPSARLIWGPDLKLDNVVLARSPAVRRS